MNTIKIYLAESGRIADLRKDFPLYQGQFQNKLLNVYVPTSILAPNFSVQESGSTIADYISSTAIKIGLRTTERNGKIYVSKTYYMRYLKTLTYQGVEYALYERKLPQEFTTFAGQGQNAPQVVANVVNIDNDTSPATIISITATQTCSLDVMPSSYLDKDETIEEPSELAELSGQVNTINQVLPTKQDKTDYALETTNKTVVGAINENKRKIELNTANIESNREDIVKNRDAIAGLNETLATGQDYIGTITTNIVPTEETLNNFVLEERGVAPKGGDTIIVILQISGDTDRNFKYIYNGTQWTYYEIPPMEQASNGTHGIIEGTYGIGLDNNTLVDISGGQILNIYVKDKDGNYQNIQTYLNMNAQDLEDIINGDSVVGEAVKAMQDGLGNNIANTYLTQVLGATKQFVRDYAQPRELSNVYFISTQGYSKQVPTTPTGGIQFSVNTNAVGSFQMFQIEKTNTASFELTSINGYANNLYISASADCDVQFRLTTEYQKVGENWGTLNVELSNVTQMRAGDVQRVQLNSPFTALGDNVLSLATGDKIRQTLSVVTQTSTPLVFNLYSNEVYPSTFAITSQSYVLEDIEKSKSQIILIGADGVVQGGNVVMTIQDANSFVEYRTNQREFIIDGNIQVVGTIDDTYPIRIEFGETVYNLYSFMKGANTPLTFGDISSSVTYNQNTGYSFDIRVLFIETSDITGFVLSPATLTAEEVLNLISDDGTVIGSVGADNKLNLMLKTELQNRIMRALITPTSAPTETEIVGINVNNSQVMITKKELFLYTHPIGSYYITEETESPIDEYGGGWLKIQGKFLLGADGSTYKVGDVDGGETTHILTIAEMPNHCHGIGMTTSNLGTSNFPEYTGKVPERFNSAGTSSISLTNFTGEDKPHNNMPPYHIVNIWKRIS
jgi:hypothetical protein